MNKVILLDRDGVINMDSDDYIKSAEEWQAIPGSLEAIGNLTTAGYKVFVITNQSGLGRGLFDMDALKEMHQKFEKELATFGGKIHKIYFCPHRPDENCSCRKPLTGMPMALEKEFRLSVKQAPFVGDSIKDLLCAQAAGAKAILVRSGKGLKSEQALASGSSGLSSTPIYDTLHDFVQDFLSNK